jgi:hypothetical protein
MYVTVMRANIRKIGLTANPMEPVMTKHVERELTNQVTELTANEMECVSGGGTPLVFTFKLVAVKTISWAHDEEAPK